MTPAIVFDDAGDSYSVLVTSREIKVRGPTEAVAKMIALFVRQAEESYSPANGDRTLFIAQQVSSRTGLKVTSARRSKQEKDIVY